MKNLLPKFKTFSVDENPRPPRYKQWVPESSDVLSAQIPYYLTQQQGNEEVQEYRKPLGTGFLPPNIRHLTDRPYNAAHPSPLAESERGVLELPILQIPKPKVSTLRQIANRTPGALYIWIKNNLAVSNDIFVQKSSHMVASSVSSNGGVHSSNVFGAASRTDTSGTETQTCYVMFATSIRVILPTNGWQVVRNFEFHPGPIGMEVEMMNSKLICAKVIPGTQAAEHGQLLEAGQIISVNDCRVITLREFQSAVALARTTGIVRMSIAVYTGAHGRLQALYEHDFQKKNLDVKSVLSNLMKVGIDKDHQHGIELPQHRQVTNTSGRNSAFGEEKHKSSKSSKSSKKSSKEAAQSTKGKSLKLTFAEDGTSASATAVPDPADGEATTTPSSDQPQIAGADESKTDGGVGNPGSMSSRSVGAASSKQSSPLKSQRSTVINPAIMSMRMSTKMPRRHLPSGDSSSEEDSDSSSSSDEEDERVRRMNMKRSGKSSQKAPSSPVKKSTKRLTVSTKTVSEDSTEGPPTTTTTSDAPSVSKSSKLVPSSTSMAPLAQSGAAAAADSSEDDSDNFTSRKARPSVKIVTEDQVRSDVLGGDNENMLTSVRVVRSVRIAEDVEYNPPAAAEDPPEEAVVADEGEVEEDDDDDDDDDEEEEEEEEVWDYATALQNAESIRFMRLVGVPEALSRSLEWGSPKYYIQFSNMSRYWDVQVFWVDEDGAMVPRTDILPGEKHLELTSEHHVWIVLATANAASQKRNFSAGFNEVGGVLDSNFAAVGTAAADPTGENGGGDKTGLLSETERVDFSPVVMVVRAASTSLAPDRCISLIWVPWNSMSTSQSAHSIHMPAHKLPPERQLKATCNPRNRKFHLQNDDDLGEPVQPSMHLQVFDVAVSSIQRRSDLSRGSGSVMLDHENDLDSLH